MNRLKQIVYEFRLDRVKERLREYARLDTSWTRFEPRTRHLEQLRLMSVRSYLENKLSGIQNAN